MSLCAAFSYGKTAHKGEAYRREYIGEVELVTDWILKLCNCF